MHSLCGWYPVTVRVTTLKGPDAGKYYVERVGDYYLDRSEPAGLWLGKGAAELSLAGIVDDEIFLRVMGGEHPYGEQRPLGRCYGESSVRGFDVTLRHRSRYLSFSQSVTRWSAVRSSRRTTPPFTPWSAGRTARTHAMSHPWGHCGQRRRRSHHCDVPATHQPGARPTDAHPCRDRQPGPRTGRPLAGARCPHVEARPADTFCALSLRTPSRADDQARCALERSRARHCRDGRRRTRGAGNILGRTQSIDRRVDAKLERFLDTFDRDPTPRERWKIEREAVIDSRPSKRVPTDATEQHAAWVEQLVTFGLRPAALVHAVTKPRDTPTIRSTDEIIQSALLAMSEKQSAWRPAELVRELAAAVPTALALDALALAGWLDELADYTLAHHCVDLSQPVPDGARCRRDGRPVTEAAIDRVFTTRPIIDEELRIVNWAERRLDRAPLDPPTMAALDSGSLTDAQRHVAESVAGQADLVIVVGPAGTGKTTALAPAVAQLRTDGRPVFGVSLWRARRKSSLSKPA